MLRLHLICSKCGYCIDSFMFVKPKVILRDGKEVEILEVLNDRDITCLEDITNYDTHDPRQGIIQCPSCGHKVNVLDETEIDESQRY